MGGTLHFQSVKTRYLGDDRHVCFAGVHGSAYGGPGSVVTVFEQQGKGANEAWFPKRVLRARGGGGPNKRSRIIRKGGGF